MCFKLTAMTSCALGAMLATAAMAEPLKVGASWANFQEERYRIEDSAIRQELGRAGALYVSTDAQSQPGKQLSDVEGLIAQGVKVLVINAQDAQAVLPAVQRAKENGIAVIAYARVIEDPYVYYIGFDNREVGRMQAREIMKHAPEGNYAFVKGGATDPNANILYRGALDVLQPAIDAGKIKNVADMYTDGWLPANAQRNMEQILTAHGNDISAVIAANDGTAGGAIAALAAQGIAGTVPVSGQDGDQAALNRIAKGTQTITVWQDVRVLGKSAADAALEFGKGVAKQNIEGTTTFSDGPRHEKVEARLLSPTPITKENLGLLIDSGWATKDAVCQGVKHGTVPACD